jgi:hypothetical protein
MYLYYFLSKYSYLLGIYIFLTGCLIFTWDASTYNPINRKYLSGCILFDIGCVFFAIDGHLILIIKQQN